ncbi:hypothetical protein TVNIR_2097 [Thioalkalivibrio nitratireducens DSM 14787]|uniref:Uncharacterized protein n=1 Tax=Thioalkalivibrio nitratireducens (strain DSM 14787 / UNIQEM 213 / ALEN2) TaxID=1255043 RepID=L0DXM4_THIND|nr:hypothetical protein [Thioalkalivibrio nitratireducens]AGA33757.1 hypothetical protein TVNIR_2097 [Thioalkalivibrio nitratireducens DSM 14787]
MLNTDPYAELDRLISDFGKAAGLPDLPDRRPPSRQFTDSGRKLRDYGDDRQRQLEQIRRERQQMKADFEAGRMQPLDVMMKETALNQRESAVMTKVAPLVAAGARMAGAAATPREREAH